jgi:hypothetical protein
MNYWYEYVFGFLIGLVGCIIVGSILDWLLPLH